MLELTNLFLTVFDPRAVLVYGFIAGLMYGYKKRHALAKQERAWIPFALVCTVTAIMAYLLRTSLVDVANAKETGYGFSLLAMYLAWIVCAFSGFASIAVIFFNMLYKEFPGHFDPLEVKEETKEEPKAEPPIKEPPTKSTEDILNDILARNKRK